MNFLSEESYIQTSSLLDADLPFETQQAFMKERDVMLEQLMRYCSSKTYTNDCAETRFGNLVLLVANIMVKYEIMRLI